LGRAWLDRVEISAELAAPRRRVVIGPQVEEEAGSEPEK
jgi:hypothetical protein